MSVWAPWIAASLLAAAPQTALDSAEQKLARGDLDGVLFALDGKSFEGDHEVRAADLLGRAAQKSYLAKDHVLALQFAQMALRTDPKQPKALEFGARAQLAVKQFAEAEAFADRWIAATEGADAILFRADLALSQGDWRRAFTLASSVEPGTSSKAQLAQARRLASRAEAELKSRKQARAELEKLDRDLAEAARKAALEERAATLAAAKQPKVDVTVYGFEGCGPCARVKGWLASNKVPYEYKDVLKDEDADQEMRQKLISQGQRPGGVPVTDVNGTLIRGANLAALETSVRKAGLLR